MGDPVLTVLIFGGKILKDHEDVKTHGIKDGQTIHLVVRNKRTNLDNPISTNTNQPRQQTNHTSSTLPTNNNNNNNNNNLNNNNSNINNNIPNSNNTTNNNRQETPTTNPLFGNLGEIQQRLQQMLISNPETMQTMMQQMMSNPNTMRSLFGSMQRMHSLMERNPEVNHLLSNPDVLRESLEMVRNPAALQEVMRNYDRQLNNMESMPGGYNVLRRMYTEFQEPLMNAFHDNSNQFAAPTSNNSDDVNDTSRTSSNTEQQRTENRDPLPNPWAPQQPAQQQDGSNISGAGTRPQFPMGLFNNANNSSPLGDLGSGADGLGANLAAALGAGGLGGADLSSLFGGSAGLFGERGGAGGNTSLGGGAAGLGGSNLDGVANMNELLQRAGRLFQDHEFMSLLQNPEAYESVMQIQQGIERLQRIAPNLFDRLGLPSFPGIFNANRTQVNNNNNNSSNNNSNNNQGGGGAGGGTNNPTDKSDKDNDNRPNQQGQQ